MAATDLERLVVQLSADITKYERAMRRAQGVTNRQLGLIQKKAKKASSDIGLSFAKTGAAIVAGLATGRAVREIAQLSDAATRIDNALKIAGLSGRELEDTYKALSKAAKDNGAPVESLVTLYSRAATVQKELGVNSEELLGFTNNVALALRVAGTDAQSASGALLQLSQALGSGTVRAEEFNSILEGALPIAQAAAAGLKEAGGSVANLRKLVIDGKISSEAFFRAFEAGSVTLKDRAANATLTLAQAGNNLFTALVGVAREFNNATGTGEKFAKTINNVAGAVSGFDVTGFINKIRSMKKELDDFLQDLGNAQVFADLNQALGVTDAEGNVLNPDVKEAETKIAGLKRDIELLQEQIQNNTSMGFDNTEALARLGELKSELISVQAIAANLPDVISGTDFFAGRTDVAVGSTPSGGPRRGGRRGSTEAVNAVSVKDFKSPVGSGKGGGGKKSDPFASEIESIKERTAALQAETAAQSQLNPLVKDYDYSVTRAKAAQDLLTAAQKSHLAVGKEVSNVQKILSGDFDDLSPKAREQATAILALSDAQAQATAEAARLAESQDKLKSAFEDFKSLAKDTLSGFISDLRQGKSATEALGNALDKIADKLLDMALNSIFDNLFNGFSLGGLGGSGTGLSAGLFGDGGYTGNGGRNQPAGIVHKGEYVFDQNSVRAAGGPAALDAMRMKLRGYANGGYVGAAPTLPNLRGSGTGTNDKVQVIVSVSDDGKLQGYVERTAGRVSARVVSVTAPGIVKQSVTDSGRALGDGTYDGAMGRFGNKAQARRR